MKRREFLAGAAAALASGLVPRTAPAWAQEDGFRADDWASVRRQFSLAPGFIHMGALLVASHPRPVQAAIDAYTRGLNEMPVTYLRRENRYRQQQARLAAARYLEADAEEFALTDSTTMGLGLVYGGLRLQPGDELLTTDQDYYATHESLRLAAAKTGAVVRQVALYRPGEPLAVEALVQRLEGTITAKTRVVALTWVHSGTGVKLPIASFGAAIERVNAARPETDRILFCVDGVHGLGIENVRAADLRCDFLIAGCHKWLFGPRGTGIVWGRPSAWAALHPTIPSFIDTAQWQGWATGNPVTGPTTSTMMTPGGFKPFEHLWALNEAFEFHRRIGKARVEARTRQLARQLKEGLAVMPHVRLITPRYDHLSAGIVSFDVAGLSAAGAVRRLAQRRIVATSTPYAVSHARLTPCIYNSPEEVDDVLRAIRALA